MHNGHSSSQMHADTDRICLRGHENPRSKRARTASTGTGHETSVALVRVQIGL